MEVGSTRVLTQEEIDSLLGYYEDPALDGSAVTDEIIARLMDPDPPEERGRPYGMFTPDRAMLRFFADPAAENTLADLRALNAAEGQPPIKVPGTSIELMNFSKCPRCGHLHSYLDLADSYQAPVRRPGVSLRQQMLDDTCVACQGCGARFQPTLVIVDGAPRAERQFLCRPQTVGAVRSYTLERFGAAALSQTIPIDEKAPKGRSMIVNDIDVRTLLERPTLITNVIQYSPATEAMRFLCGRNVGARDVLFGQQVW